MLDLIKKSKGIWTIGGLDDYRHIFKTFIYILYLSFFMFFNSLPPKKIKNIIKINTYKLGGLFFLPPSSSPPSKILFKDFLL
jgi:hypothetical protein